MAVRPVAVANTREAGVDELAGREALRVESGGGFLHGEVGRVAHRAIIARRLAIGFRRVLYTVPHGVLQPVAWGGPVRQGRSAFEYLERCLA